MHTSGLVLGLTALTWTGVMGSHNTNNQETPSYLPPFGICPDISSDASATICPAYGITVANQNKSDVYTTSTNPEPSPSSEEQATAQSPSSQPKTDQPDPSSSSPWSRGAICRRVGKDDYCAFTHSTFNNGEGISIITTPAVFLALGSQPPLSLLIPETGTSAIAAPSGPYKDVVFPGKGIGLVATEPIRTGRRIMARTPALMVDDRAFRGLRRDDLALLVAQAIVTLPETHRVRFLNLSSSHDSVDSSTPNTSSQLDLVYKIFTTNAFKTTIKLSPLESPSSLPDTETPPSPPLPPTLDFQSTFTEVSRLNHDCSPNLGYYFDSTTLSHKVYAVRDILPGEELSVSYVDVLHPLETRQRLLQTTWHFTCSCQRCGGNDADAHLTVESNSRIAQINSLRRELDSHTATGASVSGNGGPVIGTGTPAKALLLITLYELEGAQVRIYEAYYRAALEYNGVGDSAMAMGYARLCLAKGLVARGPDRPFIQSMRELVEDPVRHWSWRFRVGNGGSATQNGGGGGGNGDGTEEQVPVRPTGTR